MSHRGAPKKENRDHNVSAGRESAPLPSLLVIAKYDPRVTQLAQMPLNGSSTESKNLCHAVDRRPRTSGLTVTVIQQTEIRWQNMQADTCFPKLRNKILGFGYPVKFALSRHIFPFRICGGALWCTIHQSGGLLSQKDSFRRFFYALLRWVGYLVSELRASLQTSGGTTVAVRSPHEALLEVVGLLSRLSRWRSRGLLRALD